MGNTRANELIHACKYKDYNNKNDSNTIMIHGDVFIGRYYDNEIKDIWIRKDFTIHDASIHSKWCQKASTALSSSTSSSSLINNKHQEEEKEITEEKYKWVQSNEEIEIKILLDDTNIKAKQDISIKFQSKNKIEVNVKGNMILAGNTCYDYIIDESTYTLQDVHVVDSSSGEKLKKRELCIVLMKKDSSLWWEFAVK